MQRLGRWLRCLVMWLYQTARWVHHLGRWVCYFGWCLDRLAKRWEEIKR